MKDTQKTVATDRDAAVPLYRTEADARRRVGARFRPKCRARCADVREEGTWGGKLNEVLDAVESSEADIQEDIEFALIQMKSETLNKINDALVRLEQGNYGNCFDCGEEIAEKRLRALPFAVRCKDCEEARESRRAARASAAGAARHQLAVPRHVSIRRPNDLGAPPVAEPIPPHRRLPDSFVMRPAQPDRETRSR